jgi:hypothetical protein
VGSFLAMNRMFSTVAAAALTFVGAAAIPTMAAAELPKGEAAPTKVRAAAATVENMRFIARKLPTPVPVPDHMRTAYVRILQIVPQ